MRYTCIPHPASEPLIIVRKWQIEFCDGDVCAAALMSFFEYWHNHRLEASAKARAANDVAEMHGDARTQDQSLWQFHTEEQLEQGILIYKRSSISKSLKLLVSKGVITISRNPNPRYRFDNTRFFLFHPEPCVEFLKNRCTDNGKQSVKNNESSFESNAQRFEKNALRVENAGTIYETTKETTYENNTTTTTTTENAKNVFEFEGSCGAADAAEALPKEAQNRAFSLEEAERQNFLPRNVNSSLVGLNRASPETQRVTNRGDTKTLMAGRAAREKSHESRPDPFALARKLQGEERFCFSMLRSDAEAEEAGMRLYWESPRLWSLLCKLKAKVSADTVSFQRWAIKAESLLAAHGEAKLLEALDNVLARPKNTMHSPWAMFVNLVVNDYGARKEQDVSKGEGEKLVEQVRRRALSVDDLIRQSMTDEEWRDYQQVMAGHA